MKSPIKYYVFQSGMIQLVKAKKPQLLFQNGAVTYFVLYEPQNKWCVIEPLTGVMIYSGVHESKESFINRISESIKGMDLLKAQQVQIKQIERTGFVEGHSLNHIPVISQKIGIEKNKRIKILQKHFTRLKLVYPDCYLWEKSNYKLVLTNTDDNILSHCLEDVLGWMMLDYHIMDFRIPFVKEYLEPDIDFGDKVIINNKKGIVLEILDYDWINDVFWYNIQFHEEQMICTSECLIKRNWF